MRSVIDNFTAYLPSIDRGSVKNSATYCSLGSGGRVVARWTVNRWDGGSIPPTAVSKLRQFCLPHICLCLSEETLTAGGPFYLVSMPGEVKKEEKTGEKQGINV